MSNIRTRAFEKASEAIHMAKIVALVFWMPILVITFLSIFISFE